MSCLNKEPQPACEETKAQQDYKDAQQGSTDLARAIWRYYKRHDPAFHADLVTVFGARLNAVPDRAHQDDARPAQPGLPEASSGTLWGEGGVVSVVHKPLGGRPLTRKDVIERLDERKLGRALTDSESYELERALRLEWYNSDNRTHANRPWTEGETASLQSMLDLGFRPVDIVHKVAAKTGRTVNAVYQKINLMRRSVNKRKKGAA